METLMRNFINGLLPTHPLLRIKATTRARVLPGNRTTTSWFICCC